ncbi:sugar 3,4-ketoisomerase [Acinetobacter sp. WCHA45]|uniref:sugar 3,4-ketoisomerase n=1 Tax=Acinetobacter sp. WCHA45 TaxID=2004644 RepID=UPI000B3BF58F|nr:FdtA/QdtA family cupin domain-containing protein [Acinetobacter sp. WCHA45]AVZ84741.1 WxcM-like domain-containing protein [Acinetobacter sp. WCHA45]
MSLIKLINLPNLSDDRGGLIAIESDQSIPFEIKRVYYIFNTANKPRGFHAHKDLKQLVICIHGQCRFVLDNGIKKDEIILNSPIQGLVIESMTWREIHEFSEDCILLVLASEYYDESDYIRDYDEFLEFVK